jgi:chaperone modulatory protein CbpM
LVAGGDGGPARGAGFSGVNTHDILVARFPGLEAGQLQEWMAEGMVRAEPGPNFTEIDVARIALMMELRDDLALDDAALPVVLSLLDQLYTLRRELAALRATTPPP